MKVVQTVSDYLGLTTFSGTIGPGVNFNKTYDVRVDGADKGNDLIQSISGLFEKSGKGKR